MRWALGLNGALSIALGIAIIVWPDISLYSLVIVFGAVVFARGVVGLGAAFSGAVGRGRGWLVVSSLAGIAVGVTVFLWTVMSALALRYVIASYAIVLGVIAIGGAFWLAIDGGDRLLLALTGSVSILFGIVMFSKPGAGALALLAPIAAYSVINGISELAEAIGGKRILSRAIPPTSRTRLIPARPTEETRHARPLRHPVAADAAATALAVPAQQSNRLPQMCALPPHAPNGMFSTTENYDLA
jgi:uncharacterized membrane protein HdeD (DUF308 family)